MVAVVALGVADERGRGRGRAVSSAAPGVDASTIRSGTSTRTLQNLPAGFTLPDTGSQVDQAKAFVDDLNQRGGINGRKVELKTYKFTAHRRRPRRACAPSASKATEDDKVFAVLTPSFFADPVLCVTPQHKTPMILGGGTHAGDHRQVEGAALPPNFTTEHAIQASVDPLVKAKALKGKKLAVLLEDTPGFDTAIENGLVKPLKRSTASRSRTRSRSAPRRRHRRGARCGAASQERRRRRHLPRGQRDLLDDLHAGRREGRLPPAVLRQRSLRELDRHPHPGRARRARSTARSAPRGAAPGRRRSASRPIRSTTKCNATYAKRDRHAPREVGQRRLQVDRGHVRARSTCSSRRRPPRARTSQWPRS